MTAPGSIDLGAPLVAELLARCTFPDRVERIGVSGGADSVALALLAAAAGHRPTLVHVDHGLRPEGADEGNRVVGLADALGCEVERHRLQLEPGGDLQARARTERHRRLGPDCLLGHTADDRAETLLLNLIRGSGADGLSAMGPRRRPLLALRRAETSALCRALGVSPVDDPSNEDPRFARSRVRHELIPLLAAIGDRDPVPVLVRTAGLLADEVAFLDDLAAGLDAGDARALAEAPPALARRAVRAQVRRLTGQPPAAAAVDQAMEVAKGARRAAELPGGVRVSRSRQRLAWGVEDRSR